MSALIDRLPSELLSQIFAALVQSWLFAHSIGDDSYGPVNYPILLSSVCVRWRQVAVNTPSLWSFLDFGFTSYPLRNLQYLNLCYERSANTPLAVRFGRFNHECDEEAVDEQLASLLSSYAPRLDSLAISYWHSNFAKGVLSTLVAQGAAGRIRRLALHAISGDKHMMADPSLSQEMLDKLLKPLSLLYLDGASFDWNLISCRNLVELQLVKLASDAVPSSQQLIEFLKANPMIRRLNLSWLRLTPHESSVPPITLPELQSLEVAMSPQFTNWFFSLLTPPSRAIALHLDLIVPDRHRAQVTDTLHKFFRQARVVTLRIWGSLGLPFSSIFAHLPHLETLRIYNPELLEYDSTDIYTQTEILPKLHTVELSNCITRDVGPGLTMILCRPSIKLIAVSLFHSDPSTFAMNVEQVREFMSGIGVTADVSELPEWRPNYHPSPFV